jgi:hypothetical protein
MLPESEEVERVARALALASGYTKEQWHNGNACAWASPYYQAAKKAIAALPMVIASSTTSELGHRPRPHLQADASSIPFTFG